MALRFGNKLFSAPNLELPWSSTEELDKRFWRVLGFLCIPFLIFSLGIPFIPVPEPTREEVEQIAEAFAQLQIEEEPQPIPVEPEIIEQPEEEVVEEEIEEEVIEEEIEEEVVEEVVEPPKKPDVIKLEVAREQAKAEINQFANELAEISDMVELDDVTNTTIDSSNAQTEAEQVDRDFITSGAKATSGGVNVAEYSRDTGGGVALQGKTATQVESKLDDATEVAKAARDQQQREKSFRTDKSIQKKMNAVKGSIDRIYQRALRKDPTLQGTVTFEIVIEPDGRVSSAKIISSELNDEDLHRKLLVKIRSINFGASNVLATTLKYTFEFFPQ